MRFEFFPLRFEFTAKEPLYFPPGKASNILRGAFGLMLRRITCAPHCSQARSCEIRESCPYARFFEPVATGAGPSGFADRPRPFVFRARPLNGQTIRAGESFHFDLHLFPVDRKIIAHLVLTFAALAREGLGPGRGKAELNRVTRVPAGGAPELVICEPPEPPGTRLIEPVSLDLTPPSSGPRHIRIDFLSPTELKHDARMAGRPEFPILFGRTRDRISTLRKLYGPGPLEIDFQGAGARAAEVRMTRCEVRTQEAERRSSRTGERHSIGGFVGTAEYEGDLAEFMPYLEAGHWAGVGRQAVWGKGEIVVQR